MVEWVCAGDGKVDRMVTTITVVIGTHKKGREKKQKQKKTVLICKCGWEMVHRVSLWYWGRTE